MLLECEIYHSILLPRYTAQMIRRFIPPMLSLWLLFASLAQANATVDKIQIKGLDKGDDVEMMKNITVSLSLYSVVGKEQGESRLEYLLSQAEFQTRQALEPFGYYTPPFALMPRARMITSPWLFTWTKESRSGYVRRTLR